jgi:hypothetical protein
MTVIDHTNPHAKICRRKCEQDGNWYLFDRSDYFSAADLRDTMEICGFTPVDINFVRDTLFPEGA